jgi:hypothetical protein
MTPDQQKLLSKLTDDLKALTIASRDATWSLMDSVEGEACTAAWTTYTLLGVALDRVSSIEATIEVAA